MRPEDIESRCSRAGRLATAAMAGLVILTSPSGATDLRSDSSSAELVASSESAARSETAAQCPSRFDYVVLASLADSQRPLGLSLYRSPAQSPASGAAGPVRPIQVGLRQESDGCRTSRLVASLAKN
jgi:hypothetical protein